MEKETATHCSVLAWRIPGTGEPGGLPSMGLQRVGHDGSDSAAAAAAAAVAVFSSRVGSSLLSEASSWSHSTYVVATVCSPSSPLLPPCGNFRICKKAHKTWLRMLSIAHAKELRAPGFA